jgi:hypothetical protein
MNKKRIEHLVDLDLVVVDQVAQADQVAQVALCLATELPLPLAALLPDKRQMAHLLALMEARLPLTTPGVPLTLATSTIKPSTKPTYGHSTTVSRAEWALQCAP